MFLDNINYILIGIYGIMYLYQVILDGRLLFDFKLHKNFVIWHSHKSFECLNLNETLKSFSEEDCLRIKKLLIRKQMVYKIKKWYFIIFIGLIILWNIIFSFIEN